MTLHEILSDVRAYLAAAIYAAGVASGLLLGWLSVTLAASESKKKKEEDNERTDDL